MTEKKECYLCGETRDLTRDHLPPECMFRPPLPSNLITVPCCRNCNESFKLDDEALMIFTSAHHAVSLDGMWVWKNKALNSLRRSPKLLQNVRKSLLKVPVLEAGTVRIRSGISIPETRVQHVLIRMTKGLLCKFCPNVPYRDLEYEVEMRIPDQELVNDLYRTMRYDERGNGVFRFWRGVLEEQPTTGLWVYVFYDGMCFSVEHHRPNERLIDNDDEPTREESAEAKQ